MARLRRWLLRVLGLTATVVLLAVGFVTLAGTRSGPLPATAPGYRVAEIAAPLRGENLPLHLWYPATGSAPVELVGQNALFYGFFARPDAAGDGAPHPVVVLSHGSGGNAERLGWIASALAARGMIVAATNHPGTTSRDSLPARTVMPWERTGDLGAILDALARGAPEGILPDMARVGVLGFSLGGGTALLAAGARLSKAEFIAYCTQNPGADDCRWLAAGGVDFNAIDAARYEAAMRDPRISAAVAVDPALTRAMTGASLAAIAVPMLVINLGAPGAVPEAMRAEAAAAAIPRAEMRNVEGAAHFSFLARCSLFGVVMIATAGDDNICSDSGLRPRDVVQAELAALIGDFLAARLGTR